MRALEAGAHEEAHTRASNKNKNNKKIGSARVRLLECAYARFLAPSCASCARQVLSLLALLVQKYKY